MVDPVTPATLVPWRGKTYPLQLTLGALALASGVPGIPPILEAWHENSVFTKPEMYQRGVLLFALVYQQFPDATLIECMEAVTGDKAKFYGDMLASALKDIAPAINRLNGAETPEDKTPLAESSSGESSGPALVSTSGSAGKNSGRSRRAS